MDAEHNYLVVCNASNRDAVLKQFQKLSKHYNVEILDESDSWALMALQGPGAALLLARFVSEDLTGLKKNRKQTVILNGCMVDAARTGYTGEDGFELFCRPDDAPKVWDTLVAAGAKPCGLGARDSLRLEAGFPLYGHEFNDTTNPLCSDFAWVVKDKSFYGREAIWGKTCGKRLVGLQLSARGIARQGYSVFSADKVIGEISSGTISPFTRDSIGLAWVDEAYAKEGEKVQVEIRRDLIEAIIKKPPFF